MLPVFEPSLTGAEDVEEKMGTPALHLQEMASLHCRGVEDASLIEETWRTESVRRAAQDPDQLHRLQHPGDTDDAEGLIGRGHDVGCRSTFSSRQVPGGSPSSQSLVFAGSSLRAFTETPTAWAFQPQKPKRSASARGARWVATYPDHTLRLLMPAMVSMLLSPMALEMSTMTSQKELNTMKTLEDRGIVFHTSPNTSPTLTVFTEP